MPELWEMAATELVALVQAGKASCREVVQAHLDRIGQVNQLLNAVTVPLAETALTAAEAADQAFSRGEPSGPLSGVPMTVKENIDVAGSATTLGIARPVMTRRTSANCAPRAPSRLAGRTCRSSGCAGIPSARCAAPH